MNQIQSLHLIPITLMHFRFKARQHVLGCTYLMGDASERDASMERTHSIGNICLCSICEICRGKMRESQRAQEREKRDKIRPRNYFIIFSAFVHCIACITSRRSQTNALQGSRGSFGKVSVMKEGLFQEEWTGAPAWL